jgi:hypothetical protein
MELDEIVRETMIRLIYDQDEFTGGQEPTPIKSETATNIEFEIDNKKSDYVRINQVVESVETEKSLDTVLQELQLQMIKVKQVEYITQSAQQQQQLKSIDSPIKMVDIIATEDKFKQSVFSEIGGQIIEPDVDIKVNMITMDKEQAYIDSVKQFNTFRGGTKSELFNLSRIVFQENDKKTMETIMVGAQTAKQFQNQWSEVSRRHEGQS